MGFKARKIYKAKGWIPSSENTLEEMGVMDFCMTHPAKDLVFERKSDAWTNDDLKAKNARKVEVTVTYEVEEL